MTVHEMVWAPQMRAHASFWFERTSITRKESAVNRFDPLVIFNRRYWGSDVFR